MSNIQRMLKGVNKGRVASAFILLSFFTGVANASLSGIDPGYPRFIANKTYIDYYNVGGDTFYFDGYNVNNKVFWKDSPGATKERVKGSPDFYAQVDIDASNPLDPQVLAGSFFEMWGKIPSLGTGNTLLFAADITDVFWKKGKNAIIEFVMDGGSMQGKVCDLGFCSYADEVLQFKMGYFNGKWGKDFYKTAKAVATVPVPAAAWLFGTAIMGLFGFQRKKILTS